jgi:uncharacterized membrane protein
MKLKKAEKKLISETLLLFAGLSVIGAILFVVGSLRNGNWTHWFLLWNVVLAWVPFLLSLLLWWQLKLKRWSQWQPLLISIAWLLFLPNAFYMITDYLHLALWERVDILFDTLMFTMLVLTALMLGIVSMMIIHRQLLKRIPWRDSWVIMGAITLFASFGVYMGRELRWNTWDILIHMDGVLFDLSEILLRPLQHGRAFITTAAFFISISALYFAIWRGVELIRKLPKN